MKKSHSTGTLFSIALICLFMILAAIVLYMGVNSYKRISANKNDNTKILTTVSYISGKIRTATTPDGVSIVDAGGVNALVVADDLCYTYIYYKNGYIYDDYLYKTFDFDATGTERIMKAESFSAKIKGNLVTYKITIDGKEYTNCVAIKGGDTYEE